MKLLLSLLRSGNPCRGLFSRRSVWLVTCVVKRQEIFGEISIMSQYEVAADSADEARETILTHLRPSPERAGDDLVVIGQKLKAPGS